MLEQKKNWIWIKWYKKPSSKRNSPTIIVSSQNKLLEVKVGKKYTLPTITAVDNQNNPIEVFIIVLDVDEKVHIVSDNKYTFTKKGTYEIMFYAKDSNGIVAFERYTVKAS